MPRQTSPLSIEYVLLGFLEKEPVHGYDLYKRLSSFKSVGLVWHIKQSQLYALLERLEEEGLVTSTNIRLVTPNRKQYRSPTSRSAFHDLVLPDPVQNVVNFAWNFWPSSVSRWWAAMTWH